MSNFEAAIAVVKEHGSTERRVLLLPPEVKRLCDRNYRVLVERGAGDASLVSDDLYVRAGARIVERAEAWSAALVLKYKAPLPEEYAYLRPGLRLAATLHAEGCDELMDALCQRGVTAYSFEFLRSEEDGSFVLMPPDSEIAGKLSILYGAYHLQRHLGGRGLLLADMPRLDAPHVLVIGHGNAGGAAVRTALALGARVTVLGHSEVRLRRFQSTVGGRVECLLNTPETLREYLPQADLVVGTILISTQETPAMIGYPELRCMKPGSVLVDVTCGYGAGYLPTFRGLTTHQDPAYIVEGIVHIKIDNLPASVPATASRATSSYVAQYVEELAALTCGLRPESPALRSCKITEHGRAVHPILVESLKNRADRFDPLKRPMAERNREEESQP